MIAKTLATPLGTIRYWLNEGQERRGTLVFLPGLSADRRMLQPQIDYFERERSVLVWDPPAQGESRPFSLSFTFEDVSRYLHEILTAEGVEGPVLIGHSLGGYVAQNYDLHYPGSVGGIVIIDSGPLAKAYVSAPSRFLLRHTEPLYRLYPWRWLLRDGARGNSETAAGRQLMRDTIDGYEKDAFCRLMGHYYRIVSETIAVNDEVRLSCPTLLTCGDKDKVGFVKSYISRWHRREHLPLVWIKGAGHLSNFDAPDDVNNAITAFLREHDL